MHESVPIARRKHPRELVLTTKIPCSSAQGLAHSLEWRDAEPAPNFWTLNQRGKPAHLHRAGILQLE